MRYKCSVMYDGTNYNGFQIQKNGSSIQEEIEKVISKILNSATKIVASGRTDAKVHAKNQVFHFDCDRELDIYKVSYAINRLLPDDIYINSMERVDEMFHARFTVSAKQYDYLIKINDYDVFYKNYANYVRDELDINLMQEAAKVFVGRHDFTSFNASPLALYPNQIRTIYDIKITKEADIIRLSFIGEGFLRYMVRMLSACLIEVGRRRLTIDGLVEMMDKKDKRACKYNAPSCGLYLMNVEYFKMLYEGDLFIVREYIPKDDNVCLGAWVVADKERNDAVAYYKNKFVWIVEDVRIKEELNACKIYLNKLLQG